MAYCTQQEVESVAAAGGESLTQLCDLAGSGQMDTAALAVLSAAIAAADAWIDGYVAKKRAVPLNPVPVLIKRCSQAETLYQLKCDRGLNVQRDDELHMARESYLRDIASGRHTLGVDPQPAKSALVSPAVVTPDDASTEITAKNLEGLW
jgi:phage gp36-like protein